MRISKYICLIILVVFPTILHANDSPEKVLEKFNNSSTTEEAVKYLTGEMKSQLEPLDKDKQEKIIKRIQLKSYEPKTEAVGNDFQLVIAKKGKLSDGKESPSLIYEFVKDGGEWKIKNRYLGDNSVIGLFKEKFSPDRFHAQNAFELDGKKVNMESAFAYFVKKKDNKKEIIVKFYPFKFQERDVEFFKYGSGPVVKDVDMPTAVASSIKYPQSEMTIYLNENNQIISFCQNGDNFKDDYIHYNLCVQPPSPNVVFQKFNVSENNWELSTKSGEVLKDGKKIDWDININLPLLEKGTN